MPQDRKGQRNKCEHQGEKPCKSWAQKDSKWCFAHNPDGRAQKRIAETKKMNAEGRMR